jgi:2-polyprenyl-3-methyl-5-hydroxy-6-metoxy-1,4-benzoquinol methylase
MRARRTGLGCEPGIDRGDSTALYDWCPESDSDIRLAAVPAIEDLQGRQCPACGGELADWRWVPTSEPALGDTQFLLRRCTTCGSAVTVGAVPERLHDLGAYRPGRPRLHTLVRPLLRAFDQHRLTMIRQVSPGPSRLLDVGAGRGRFVAAARAAGYQADGIEPSARGVAGAREIGVVLAQASIEEAAVPARSLGVVTLWHVLEHLDEPGQALKRIAGWLRPGGAILVGVPNLASLQAWVGGEGWYHLDVPRHRVHYTADGVQVLLRRSGFEVVRTHHVLAEHNPFGMWQSVLNRVTTTPSYVYNLLKRNASIRSTDLLVSGLGVPLAPFAALAELAAAAAGRGGTVAVLATRAAGDVGSVP